MTIEIVEATRTGMLPLIGVYGKSGSGKTHSALLLARGLAGPGKEIGIIDTERKRSGALVGLIPGNFKQINLDAPFEPEAYMDAIKAAEAANWGCAVIDSLTHEWDGEGGILEMQEAELDRMAGTDFRKREACKMAAWIKPKQRHKALIQHILRCKIPLICCLRADEKTRMIKEEGKSTQVLTDKFSTPIFDKRFIFEMLANLETVQHEQTPGCCYVTKWTHPDILKCFPETGKQLGIEHGENLARWCLGTATAPAPAKESANLKSLKRGLWELTKSIHHEDPATLQRWLWDEACMDPARSLAAISESELRAIIAIVTKKLSPHA